MGTAVTRTGIGGMSEGLGTPERGQGIMTQGTSTRTGLGAITPKVMSEICLNEDEVS